MTGIPPDNQGKNMSSKHLEILFVNPPKTGVNAKGKPWSMTEAECIVRDADGVPSVGVLLFGRNMDPTKVSPGHFTADFDLEVGYKDRKIGAVVTALHPVVPAKVVAKVGL
jgi:hypothetical protein